MTAVHAEFDARMMGVALRMAKRGLGTTAPNPAVGAIIVDEATGEIIARGWTQPGGRPHAEKEALRRAGERARGMTMYLTLEPCANTGRLPTCADAMQTAGLKRVVCAIPDPNPLISGRGFEQLREAGVEVDVGVRAQEASWMTAGHILRQTKERPFVQVKMALDDKGNVPFGEAGRPHIVTGEASRALAHLLRAETDGILIGIGTAIDDDPRLTCRLPGLTARSPVRVVVDSRLRLPPSSKLAESAKDVPLWVMTGPEAAADRRKAFEKLGANVALVPANGEGRLKVEVLLKTLALRGMTRLLVEGGPAMWASFFAAGVVDEAIVFVAGAAGKKNGASGIERWPNSASLVLVAERDVGEDRMFTYRSRRFAGNGHRL